MMMPFSRRRTGMALVVLALLVFSKNIYIASLSSYYTFYTIHRFGITLQQSQLLLFAFLGSTAVDTMLGGLVGDRVGAKTVIWFSILGVLPFTLALPYADLNWTMGLLGPDRPHFIVRLSSNRCVRAGPRARPSRHGGRDLLWLRVGMAGIAAAVLGVLADAKGIDYVYQVCSYLPLIGLLTVLLLAVEERPI